MHGENRILHMCGSERCKMLSSVKSFPEGALGGQKAAVHVSHYTEVRANACNYAGCVVTVVIRFVIRFYICDIPALG